MSEPIVIDPDFKDLIPPLSQDEYKALEQSILNDGCRDAVVVWNNTIVDGHNRYSICAEHDIDFNTVHQDFADRDSVIIWMIKNQFARRNISDFLRGELAYKLKSIYREQAEKNQGVRTDLLATLPKGNEGALEPISTREELANHANISARNMAKVQTVIESAPEPVIKKARAGDISINRADKITRALKKTPPEYIDRYLELCGDNDEKVSILNRLFKSMGSATTNGTHEEILRTGGFSHGDEMDKRVDYLADTVQEINKGLQSIAKYHKNIQMQANRQERVETILAISEDKKYQVIYADPPWQYDFSNTDSRKIENHYPTMDIEDIKGMAIEDIADINSVLFLWATTAKLVEAMYVISEWGFTYKTSAVWVKDKIGMGYYFRGQHEFLLVATKGNIPAPQAKDRPSSIIKAPRTEHSAKPHKVYDIIEAMYPEFNKVELFARNKRDGWDGWGNEYGDS